MGLLSWTRLLCFLFVLLLVVFAKEATVVDIIIQKNCITPTYLFFLHFLHLSNFDRRACHFLMRLQFFVIVEQLVDIYFLPAIVV